MVKLIHDTVDGEKTIAYCARVSSPNQDNPNYAGLLRYCIKHGHHSVFEMASMCVEITTSRAISAQILRHRSFSFQEFSQRYSAVSGFENYEARRQDSKNRQNSIADMSKEDLEWFENAQSDIQNKANELYQQALAKGIAKEQARFLLPMAATTRLYMHGTIRSWIHYLNVRCSIETQKEHRDIALAIKSIFVSHYPTIALALGWENQNESTSTSGEEITS